MEDFIGFIYITTNKINGVKYIGQHTKFKEDYFGSGTLLCRAIEKYGRENFEREIIDYAKTKEDLNKLELEYIKKHDAVKSPFFYNIAEGGNVINYWQGKKRSKETIEKLSKASKEILNRPEIKEKYSGVNNPMYGRPKELAPMYGRKHSEETRKKISIAKRKAILEGRNKTNSKGEIIVTYPDGTIKEFERTSEFAKEIGRGAAQRLVNGWIPKKGKFVGYKANYKRNVQSPSEKI